MYARHLDMARVRREGLIQLSLSASIQRLRATFPRLDSFPGGFQWRQQTLGYIPWASVLVISFRNECVPETDL